jgi:hypothetical protein
MEVDDAGVVMGYVVLHCFCRCEGDSMCYVTISKEVHIICPGLYRDGDAGEDFVRE